MELAGKQGFFRHASAEVLIARASCGHLYLSKSCCAPAADPLSRRARLNRAVHMPFREQRKNTQALLKDQFESQRTAARSGAAEEKNAQVGSGAFASGQGAADLGDPPESPRSKISSSRSRERFVRRSGDTTPQLRAAAWREAPRVGSTWVRWSAHLMFAVESSEFKKGAKKRNAVGKRPQKSAKPCNTPKRLKRLENQNA